MVLKKGHVREEVCWCQSGGGVHRRFPKWGGEGQPKVAIEGQEKGWKTQRLSK